MQESTSRTRTLQEGLQAEAAGAATTGAAPQEPEQQLPGTTVMPDDFLDQFEAMAAGSLQPSPQQLNTIRRQFWQMEVDSEQPEVGAAEHPTQPQPGLFSNSGPSATGAGPTGPELLSSVQQQLMSTPSGHSYQQRELAQRPAATPGGAHYPLLASLALSCKSCPLPQEARPPTNNISSSRSRQQWSRGQHMEQQWHSRHQQRQQQQEQHRQQSQHIQQPPAVVSDTQACWNVMLGGQAAAAVTAERYRAAAAIFGAATAGGGRQQAAAAATLIKQQFITAVW